MVVVFSLFSFLAIVAACMVIKAMNPVHSVLYLIVTFIATAGMFLLLNIEFVGIIIVVVYVGAIAVLFLFVVMLLNIRMVEVKDNSYTYIPISGLLGLIFLFEMMVMIRDLLMDTSGIISINWIYRIDLVPNSEVLGAVLYTYMLYILIIGGCILFLAMIAAIVLTFHERVDSKKQITYKQVVREFDNAVILRVHKCPGMESNQRHRDFQSLALPLSYLNKY
jgi:NADH-quinone oxidoreductase subunit J